MRLRSILLIFLGLIVLGAGALYLNWVPRGVSDYVSGTRSSIDEAATAAAERVADQWLSGEQPLGRGDSPRSEAAALAVAIRVGRAHAEAAGAEPVPDRLKRQFKNHYSDHVLEDARWIIASPDSRLGRILARWPVEEGAVTLGHVIVFKTRSASRNRELFAHELEHVGQYAELGINEFARRYAADPEPLEAQARKKARRVERSL